MSHPERPRIRPVEPPFEPKLQERFDTIMPPGIPPLLLFRVLARDERLHQRLGAGNLLDRGNVSIRQRELVINRVTARCGSEYEWGVHVAFFAARAELSEIELASLVHGSPDDACWNPEERVLLEIVDSLDRDCDVSDALWGRACLHFSETTIMEIMMLAGQYRMVSYLTRALRLPLEHYAPRFPSPQAGPC